MHGVSIFFQQVGTQLQTISVLHITIQMYLPYYLHQIWWISNFQEYLVSSLLKYFRPGHLFRFAHSFNHVDISRHIDKSNEQDPETSLGWIDCEPFTINLFQLQKSGKLSLFQIVCKIIVFLLLLRLYSNAAQLNQINESYKLHSPRERGRPVRVVPAVREAAAQRRDARAGRARRVAAHRGRLPPRALHPRHAHRLPAGLDHPPHLQARRGLPGARHQADPQEMFDNVQKLLLHSTASID